MTSENERLLKAAGMGDIEAFESLTGSYFKKVYNILLAACGKSDDASELAQEVFVRVFRNIKSVKCVNSLGSCIYKAVRDISLEIPCGARKIS